MRGLTVRIKTILLACGIALGLSACAVYEPAPYYYSSPGYTYYPSYGYYYGPSVWVHDGWGHDGWGHGWHR